MVLNIRIRLFAHTSNGGIGAALPYRIADPARLSNQFCTRPGLLWFLLREQGLLYSLQQDQAMKMSPAEPDLLEEGLQLRQEAARGFHLAYGKELPMGGTPKPEEGGELLGEP